MPDLVSDLIDEVGRIERENEAAYLELGRIFPRLLEEMEHSAEKGERSFSALAAIGLARSGESSERGQSYSLEGAKRFFLAVREQDSSFLAKINEGISRLDELEAVISLVRADSEEMELISLNAMTVAIKSGAAGKAFLVITDELKKLSGHTIDQSEQVTSSGRQLLEFFARLRDALANWKRSIGISSLCWIRLWARATARSSATSATP